MMEELKRKRRKIEIKWRLRNGNIKNQNGKIDNRTSLA